MARRDTMLKEAWRVIARKGGRTVSGIDARDEAHARESFESLADLNLNGKVFDNVELQIRPPGRARYRPLLQAVGENRIDWSFKCDACSLVYEHVHCPECGSLEHSAAYCDMEG